MSAQNNNTMSLEDIAIKKAIAHGHRNPRECQKHQDCLYASGADRRILDYKVIESSDIISNNIRVNDVDQQWCKDYLYPLMQRKEKDSPESLGLDYPILVTQRDYKYEIVSGHNRRWSITNLAKGTKIPVFLIDNRGTLIQKLFGKIKAGSKSDNDNRDYKMIDVALQFQQFEAAGGLTDVSDSALTRAEFENFMDTAHPNAFIHPGPRTKIFNMWRQRNSKTISIHITWDKDFYNSVLTRNGYPSNYYLNDRNVKKEHSKLSNVCTKRKCFVTHTIHDHVSLRTTLFELQEKFLQKEFQKTYSSFSLHLVVKLKNIPSNEVDLSIMQREYLQICETTNKVLQNCKSQLPLLETIIFPARLTSQGKKDTVFTLNKKTGKFQ